MYRAYLTIYQAERTKTAAEQRELDRMTGELAASLAGLGRSVARPFRARRPAPHAGLPERRPAALACAPGCPGSVPAAGAGSC